MKREVFPEYLGDVSTEQLLQNVTNTNPTAIAWRSEYGLRNQ